MVDTWWIFVEGLEAGIGKKKVKRGVLYIHSELVNA